VHSGRLQDAAFSIAKGGLDLNTLAKTTPQVQFYLVGRDIHEFAHAKDRLEVFRDSHVDFVRTLCAEGRLRIVLQKEVGPLREAHRLAFFDCIENVVVSGLKPLSEFSLGFIPVLSLSRFPATNSIPVAIPNPPDLAFFSAKHNTVVFS
jgi:hypothetical protein